MYVLILYTLFCLDSCLGTYEEKSKSLLVNSLKQTAKEYDYWEMGAVGATLNEMVESANSQFGGVIIFEILVILVEATCSIYFFIVQVEQAMSRDDGMPGISRQ